MHGFCSGLATTQRAPYTIGTCTVRADALERSRTCASYSPLPSWQHSIFHRSATNFAERVVATTVRANAGSDWNHGVGPNVLSLQVVTNPLSAWWAVFLIILWAITFTGTAEECTNADSTSLVKRGSQRSLRQ